MKIRLSIIGMLILIVASAGCSIRWDPQPLRRYPTNTSDPHGCEIGLTNCSGSCVDLQIDRWNCGSCRNICPIGAYCNQSVCLCEPGETRCNGYCANLQNDMDNCGECSHECEYPDDRCSHGTCTFL